MDAFEKKPDDDDEDIPEKGATRGPGEGAPKGLAADADIANHKKAVRWRKKMDEIGEVLCRPDTQDLFTTFQAKADPVYQMFGMQAGKPVEGEKLIAYPPQ